MRVQLSNMQLVYQTLCDYCVKKYTHKFEEFLRLITVVYHLPLLAELPAHEEELLSKEKRCHSTECHCELCCSAGAMSIHNDLFSTVISGVWGLHPRPPSESASRPYWGTYIPQTPSCASPLVKCSLCPSIHGTHETV